MMSRKFRAFGSIACVIFLFLLLSAEDSPSCAQKSSSFPLKSLIGQKLDAYERALGRPKSVIKNPPKEGQMSVARNYNAPDGTKVVLMKHRKWEAVPALKAKSDPKRIDAIEVQFKKGTSWRTALANLGFDSKGVTERKNEDGNFDLAGIQGAASAEWISSGHKYFHSSNASKNDTGSDLLYLLLAD